MGTVSYCVPFASLSCLTALALVRSHSVWRNTGWLLASKLYLPWLYFFLYCTEVTSFWSYLLQDFYHEAIWTLSNACPLFTEKIVWFLSWSLFIWCVTLVCSWMLNQPCIPGMKPSLLWYMILMSSWILFVRILLKKNFLSSHGSQSVVLGAYLVW